MSSDTGGVNVLPTCIAVLSLSAIMLCLCIVAALMRQLPLRADDVGSLSFIFAFSGGAFGGSGNSPAAPSGLDPAAIQRLPMTVIAAKTKSELGSSSSSEECSVCISELSHGDKARMLPPCGHTFHVECIDLWLLSCATCPLCRNAVVVPSAPVPALPVSVIASTSADAAAVDLTRAPTAVPGPADVAIHIDAEFAAAAFREGDETVPPNTRARLVHLFTVSSAVPTCLPSICLYGVP